MSKVSPFDFVNDLSQNKKYILENEKDYNAYIINRAFSYFQDTVFHANEMNKAILLPAKLQHDFYFHSVKAKKRFSRWHKKLEDPDVEFIAQCYNINMTRAREYRKLLSDEQLDELKRLFNKGGVND